MAIYGDFYHHLNAHERKKIDAIEEKLPRMRGRTVMIQRDRVEPHTGEGPIRDLESAVTGVDCNAISTVI
jgi:transcriptional regulator of NAD metabolism